MKTATVMRQTGSRHSRRRRDGTDDRAKAGSRRGRRRIRSDFVDGGFAPYRVANLNDVPGSEDGVIEGGAVECTEKFVHFDGEVLI